MDDIETFKPSSKIENVKFKHIENDSKESHPTQETYFGFKVLNVGFISQYPNFPLLLPKIDRKGCHLLFPNSPFSIYYDVESNQISRKEIRIKDSELDLTNIQSIQNIQNHFQNINNNHLNIDSLNQCLECIKTGAEEHKGDLLGRNELFFNDLQEINWIDIASFENFIFMSLENCEFICLEWRQNEKDEIVYNLIVKENIGINGNIQVLHTLKKPDQNGPIEFLIIISTGFSLYLLEKTAMSNKCNLDSFPFSPESLLISNNSQEKKPFIWSIQIQDLGDYKLLYFLYSNYDMQSNQIEIYQYFKRDLESIEENFHFISIFRSMNQLNQKLSIILPIPKSKPLSVASKLRNEEKTFEQSHFFQFELTNKILELKPKFITIQGEKIEIFIVNINNSSIARIYSSHPNQDTSLKMISIAEIVDEGLFYLTTVGSLYYLCFESLKNYCIKKKFGKYDSLKIIKNIDVNSYKRSCQCILIGSDCEGLDIWICDLNNMSVNLLNQKSFIDPILSLTFDNQSQFPKSIIACTSSDLYSLSHKLKSNDLFKWNSLLPGILRIWTLENELLLMDKLIAITYSSFTKIYEINSNYNLNISFEEILNSGFETSNQTLGIFSVGSHHYIQVTINSIHYISFQYHSLRGEILSSLYFNDITFCSFSHNSILISESNNIVSLITWPNFVIEKKSFIHLNVDISCIAHSHISGKYFLGLYTQNLFIYDQQGEIIQTIQMPSTYDHEISSIPNSLLIHESNNSIFLLIGLRNGKLLEYHSLNHSPFELISSKNLSSNPIQLIPNTRINTNSISNSNAINNNVPIPINNSIHSIVNCKDCLFILRYQNSLELIETDIQNTDIVTCIKMNRNNDYLLHVNRNDEITISNLNQIEQLITNSYLDERALNLNGFKIKSSQLLNYHFLFCKEDLLDGTSRYHLFQIEDKSIFSLKFCINKAPCGFGLFEELVNGKYFVYIAIGYEDGEVQLLTFCKTNNDESLKLEIIHLGTIQLQGIAFVCEFVNEEQLLVSCNEILYVISIRKSNLTHSIHSSNVVNRFNSLNPASITNSTNSSNLMNIVSHNLARTFIHSVSILKIDNQIFVVVSDRDDSLLFFRLEDEKLHFIEYDDRDRYWSKASIITSMQESVDYNHQDNQQSHVVGIDRSGKIVVTSIDGKKLKIKNIYQTSRASLSIISKKIQERWMIVSGSLIGSMHIGIQLNAYEYILLSTLETVLRKLLSSSTINSISNHSPSSRNSQVSLHCVNMDFLSQYLMWSNKQIHHFMDMMSIPEQLREPFDNTIRNILQTLNQQCKFTILSST